jgi:hypothetical protein
MTMIDQRVIQQRAHRRERVRAIMRHRNNRDRALQGSVRVNEKWEKGGKTEDFPTLLGALLCLFNSIGCMHTEDVISERNVPRESFD